MIAAIKRIYSDLSDLNHTWAITGGCNMYLRGCVPYAKDIDVITDWQGASAIFHRLEPFAIQRLSHSQAGNVRSWFFRAIINGIPIEIMGAPENRIRNMWIRNTMWIDRIELFNMGEAQVPLTTLEYERTINLQLGNKSRVNVIDKALHNYRMQPIGHKAASG